MIIMVSACLAGENCKYNGGNNRNKKVEALFNGNRIIPICPEVMGGLSTPRVPSEIVHGIVMNKDGVNVDREYRCGAEMALKIAEREQPETLIDGPGLTAELLMRHGFRVVDVEDL